MKSNEHQRGYDMAELQLLRATNALRIEIEKERLRALFNPTHNANNQLDNIYSRIGGVTEAVEYGLKTYRIVKKVTDLFRKKKK